MVKVIDKPDLRTQHGRLRYARMRKFSSMRSAANANGWNENTYKSHEQGIRRDGALPEDDAKNYARAFGVSVTWLMTGRGEPHAPEQEARQKSQGYPLVGMVGAGGAGLYADDWESGEPLGWIEPLPGMPVEAEIIALETDGNSMVPLVFDGDLAFFGPVRRDVDALLNQRVMARLRDGRRYFKILKRGEKEGTYTLRSLNQAHEDIENVAVEWVLPYRGSKPR